MVNSWRLVTLTLALVVSLSLLACQAPAAPSPTNAPAGAAPAATQPAVAAAAKPSGKQALLSISVSPIGSGGYTYGAAISSIIGKYEPGIKISVLPTSGVIDGTKLLRDGKVEIGTGSTSVDSDAVNGTGSFTDGKVPNLQLLWPAYTAPLHMFALKSANVKSVADLKGKKVAVLQTGAAGRTMAELVLKAAGIAGDVTLRPGNQEDIVSSLKDGTAAAAMTTLAKNAPTIQDLSNSREIVFLDFPDDLWNKVKAELVPGAFVADTIPVGTYKGLDQPAKSFTSLTEWNVLDKFDDDLAYTIVKTFFDHKAEADQVHPVIKETTPEMVGGEHILPYHKGSERYFKEKGWLKK